MKHKCFSLGGYNSEGMLSDNPHNGCYETDKSRTIDLKGCNPACNQGGIIVLACLEGNGGRPSHQGSGIREGEVMYTLNSTEVHGVIYQYDS